MIVQQHNSWQFIGPKEVMILTKDSHGRVLATGSLQIYDFFAHPFQAVVFTVVYRVSYRQPDGMLFERDYLLAQGTHLPKVSERPETVQLEMQSGPGAAIGGEYLWDATRVGRLTMEVTISLNSEVKETALEKQMRERLEMLQQSMKNDKSLSEETQALMEENLKLKL